MKGLGALVLSSATTVDEARWLEDHGADVVIAQGVEAGGHRGMFLTTDLTTQLGTMTLVPQVLAAVTVPVIAAGGIVDAAGCHAACWRSARPPRRSARPTCCAPRPRRAGSTAQALASEAARHTALTNLFTGRPARGIVNRFMERTRADEPLPAGLPARRHRGGAAAGRRRSGRERRLLAAVGRAEHLGCREIPAGELTRALAGF